MSTFLTSSVFLGVFISLAAYQCGIIIRDKSKFSLANPLLLSIVFIIIFLKVCGIDYHTYYDGARYISYLLTPATICLAVPLYEQIKLLTRNLSAIIGGITAGMLAGLLTVYGLCRLFHFDHAIGMGVSQELGGYVSITVAAIIATGILGNILAEPICKLFGIKDPVAKGIACGSAAHAMGTTKAMEMGSIEGAMSSLSLVASGVLTVVGASLFALLL